MINLPDNPRSVVEGDVYVTPFKFTRFDKPRWYIVEAFGTQVATDDVERAIDMITADLVGGDATVNAQRT